MTKWGLTQEGSWFNIQKPISVIHPINRPDKKGRQHNHLHRHRKAYDLTKHPFLIKTHTKLGIEGIPSTPKKSIYKVLIANITLTYDWTVSPYNEEGTVISALTTSK